MFETKSLNLVKTPTALDAVFSKAALNSLRVGILSISKSAEFLGLHCQSLSVEIHSRFEFQATHSTKVSLLGVDSLWGDCTFIPGDWGS